MLRTAVVCVCVETRHCISIASSKCFNVFCNASSLGQSHKRSVNLQYKVTPYKTAHGTALAVIVSCTLNSR